MREISTEDIKFGEHIIINGKEYVARKGKHGECMGCAFEGEQCEYIPCGEYILKNVNEIEKPHGRLIDAYSLAVKVAEAQDKLKGKDYDPFMLLGDVLRWIELEPTVLEASTSTDRFCNTEGCSNSKPDMSKAQNHICPYYQGVCSLDENILCYCEHHYEMCEKFLKVGKEKKK